MGSMGRQLVVATNNAHKVRELIRLFPDWRLRTPAELGVTFAFEERGSSYLENALGKARQLYSQVKRPVLADDSGLEVPALGGEPGIRSSRYGAQPAGPQLGDVDRYRLLLQKAEGLADRSCFFVCCIALVLDESRFFTAQEVCRGQLARGPSGSGGFGYDPVVFLPELGRTMAELSDRQKDHVSHRGRAACRLRAMLRRAPE
jgi:XTP/dITP diphosphohydrolase